MRYGLPGEPNVEAARKLYAKHYWTKSSWWRKHIREDWKTRVFYACCQVAAVYLIVSILLNRR